MSATKDEVRAVVDLLTPECWAKRTSDSRIVSVAESKKVSCFQFGFMFEQFWYLKEAEACRRKEVTRRTNNVWKTLQKRAKKKQ